MRFSRIATCQTRLRGPCEDNENFLSHWIHMSIAKAILDTKFIHRSSVKKKDVTYLDFSKETTHAWVTLDFGRQTDAIPLPSFASYGFITMWTETIFTAGNYVHLNAARTLLCEVKRGDPREESLLLSGYRILSVLPRWVEFANAGYVGISNAFPVTFAHVNLYKYGPMLRSHLSFECSYLLIRLRCGTDFFPQLRGKIRPEQVTGYFWMALKLFSL
ncbi:hypothetical protein RB195_004892 [Necator americanus]|uniref:Uncharacterized protein n=1 Tax=Necator americanus TaxID=51031 RepID=A0ABR1BNJ8_NECAM